jgi:GST-like protein
MKFPGGEAASAALILYGMNSPNVVKVAIMLEELELAYELRHVAVFKAEQFTPQFLAMNPLGKVPVLVDQLLPRALAESGAILFWLAERSGLLLPSEGPARYEIMQWVMVQMSSIGPMLGQLNHFRLLPKGSEPYASGRYLALAERLYGLLNERLVEREWMAGDVYSIADIAMYPWSRYLERHGFDPAIHPALLRWRTAIAARSAVKRAEQRMGEAFNELSTQSRRTATTEDLDRFFGRTRDMPPADFTALTR